jgi:predicted metalloprotease
MVARYFSENNMIGNRLENVPRYALINLEIEKERIKYLKQVTISHNFNVHSVSSKKKAC